MFLGHAERTRGMSCSSASHSAEGTGRRFPQVSSVSRVLALQSGHQPHAVSASSWQLPGIHAAGRNAAECGWKSDGEKLTKTQECALVDPRISSSSLDLERIRFSGRPSRRRFVFGCITRKIEKGRRPSFLFHAPRFSRFTLGYQSDVNPALSSSHHLS